MNLTLPEAAQQQHHLEVQQQQPVTTEIVVQLVIAFIAPSGPSSREDPARRESEALLGEWEATGLDGVPAPDLDSADEDAEPLGRIIESYPEALRGLNDMDLGSMETDFWEQLQVMYGRVRSLEESIRVATFHEAVCGPWCTVLKGHVKKLRALRDDYKGHCETLEAKRHHSINIRINYFRSPSSVDMDSPPPDDDDY